MHVSYQPRFDLFLGSTPIGIELSDFAVLLVVAAAVLVAMRRGWQPLRAASALWVVVGLFLGLVAAGTVYPLLRQDDYSFLDHLVSAATFVEYALVAPALPLLLRSPRDARPVLWSAAGVSAAASGWGLLQFAGLVAEFEGKRPLQREPSFVGIHDLAALSGATFALGAAVFLLGGASERRLGVVAGVAGSVGLVLAGAVTGVVGIALAAALALAVARARSRLTAGRGAAVVAGCALVGAGVLLIRGGEVTRFFHELGVGSEPKAESSTDSYVHRSLLAYVGLRIFADHPLLGVGWHGSEELENYGPYLDDARRRYPDATDVAFPSPAHPWGTQNAYLQALADLGIAGFACFVALLATGVAIGTRAALRAPPERIVPVLAGPLWLLVAAGVWNGVGLVAGIPLAALTWLGAGLAAAAAGWRADG